MAIRRLIVPESQLTKDHVLAIQPTVVSKEPFIVDLTAIPDGQRDPIGNWHSPFFLDGFLAALRTRNNITSQYLVPEVRTFGCQFQSPITRKDTPLIELTSDSSDTTFGLKVTKKVEGAEAQMCAEGKLEVGSGNVFLDPESWYLPYYALTCFETRQLLSADAGFPYERLTNEGYVFVARALQGRFLFPIPTGAEVEINVVLKTLKEKGMTFFYAVYGNHAPKQPSAEIEVTQILLRRDTMRPTEIPEWFKTHVVSYYG